MLRFETACPTGASDGPREAASQRAHLVADEHTEGDARRLVLFHQGARIFGQRFEQGVGVDHAAILHRWPVQRSAA